MAKKHFYTQKLLNTLWGFVSEDISKLPQCKFFTEGILYTQDALYSSDTKFVMKATIPDVPKEFKGKICDNKEFVLGEWKDENLELLNKICEQTRPKSFILNVDKWKKVYNQYKTKKRPKNYDRLSPYECVELTDGLVVKTKDFNKFVNFCEKNDVRLIKYNDTSYTCISNYLQLVGTNCNNFFVEDEKLFLNKYE